MTLTKPKTKKQAIHEAAARLFRDKGYTATSMRDLAEAVQLKASSLYNHIGSKEEILKEICFANAALFLEKMEWVENADLSAIEKIKALIHFHIEIATQDITSITAFNDEWRHLSQPHLENFLQLRRKYESKFKAIIEKGIENGEIKNLPVTIMLHTIFSSIRWIYDWYKPEGQIRKEELQESLSELLIEGLKG